MPHVAGKRRACSAAGVDVTVLPLDAGIDSEPASRLVADAIAGAEFDAVFVQIPLPAGIDEADLMREVPPHLDIDVMTPERVVRYLSGLDDEPPVTVTAALLLLDEHDVDIDGRRGVVVAQESDFALLFGEALRRQGARMQQLADPAISDLEVQLRDAQLVVAAAAQPGVVSTAMLAPGCVAIDAGYFNSGGRGDIDVSPGIEHLAALMPVPGGIGPMTVSVLVERVVRMAER
jgi:methylenetetrahydrofolate dehydrogenase (NADP+) / methenyltetrahydrofolate cyclohydrolase